MKFATMIFKPVYALAIALLLTSQLAMSAEEKSAYDVVKDTADELVAELNRDPARFEKDPGLYEKVVRDILVPAADFKVISKQVMGKNYYTKATKDQRAKFVIAFKESLIKTYSSGLELFDNQEITVLTPTAEDLAKKNQPVHMEVKTGEGTIFPLQFSMRKNKAGQWKVVNIIINGVNVGKAYRNHFAESASKSNGDIDQVIATWNADLAAQIPEAAAVTK